MQPIVDNKAFEAVAKSKPDFSALKGVQLAVAVTGFETSEEKLTDEHSVGRIQPHFVAIADTHAWNFQAVGFAEKKLGAFVENIYDSAPTLEKSDKNGGKYFIWTAKDGRKAYALVIDSIIYFGNDETAIDKCLAVKRGEADSIVKTGKVQPADPTTLASGYVSTDGIAQIANIVGLKFASDAGEDSEVQSAIAGILPQLLRNSITEISWTATKTVQGIEDKYLVTMPPEIANALVETFAPNENPYLTPSPDQIRGDISTVTVYNIKNPQIAWRSVMLVAQKQMGALESKVFVEFSHLLFEPYGVNNVEEFLSSINGPVVTATIDASGEQPVVVVTETDGVRFLKALLPEVKPYASGIGTAPQVLDEGEMGVVTNGDFTYVGNANAVIRCSGAPNTSPIYELLQSRLQKASILTAGRDTTTTLSLVDMLAHEGHGDTRAISTYFTETRFTKSGMERRTVSDFGLIGSIIAQLAQD